METPVISSVMHASLQSYPPNIVSSKGSWLRTADGVNILDASGGPAVSSIGHGHPRVKQAIVKQLDAVEYVYAPWFATDVYEKLAKYLCDSTGGIMQRVFVTGSGAEALEAAIKMSRQYWVEKKEPRRTKFIARDRSYHGNTLGSLALSGHKVRRAVYEPLLSQNFSFVSPCYAYRGKKDSETDEQYVARLAKELEDEFQRLGPDTVCAFFAETVSGLTLGGVAAVPGYLKTMKAVCDKHGALFVLDEVFAGMGRTGTLHAWEQEDVIPDLQTVAKGLGAGYQAVGALLASKKVVDAFDKGSQAFMHFQTYHGHPIACAAAYEVQQILKDEGLVENCRQMGAYLGQRLEERLGSHKNVGDIRGRGLVWGVELVKDRASKTPFPATDKIAPKIQAAGLRKEIAVAIIPGGGVADGTNGDVMVITPAFNVTQQEVDTIVERTARAIEAVLGGGKESKL